MGADESACLSGPSEIMILIMHKRTWLINQKSYFLNQWQKNGYICENYNSKPVNV